MHQIVGKVLKTLYTCMNDVMDYSAEFNIEQIDTIADEVIKRATSKVILFYGEMGSGKTTLIRSIVKQLGGLDDVSSPTFSLVNEYEINSGLVYHFDMYRLEDPVEALDIGFEEYLYSGHWVFIEWPEKVEALLPKESNKIYIKEGKIRSRALDLELVNS